MTEDMKKAADDAGMCRCHGKQGRRRVGDEKFPARLFLLGGNCE